MNQEEPFMVALNSRARVVNPSLQEMALPGEAVQNSQNPVRASVLKPLMLEVQTPGLVRGRQLQLELARDIEASSASSVQPKALLAPDPSHRPDVHARQKVMNPSEPIAGDAPSRGEPPPL